MAATPALAIAHSGAPSLQAALKLKFFGQICYYQKSSSSEFARMHKGCPWNPINIHAGAGSPPHHLFSSDGSTFCGIVNCIGASLKVLYGKTYRIASPPMSAIFAPSFVIWRV